MKKIEVEDINFDLDYEGYLWCSNESAPKQVNKISRDDFTTLPFIVEGNLYSAKDKISVRVGNIDGAYFITQGIVKDLPEEQITRQEFVAHKLDGIAKVKMIQYWEESEKDELLEGMKTLKPSWSAFVGFIKNDEK